jgi:hypothetical protein
LAVPSSQNTDRAPRHPIEEKAGPAPAFFIFHRQAAARCCHRALVLQQTVDGLQGTLENPARSSYVPSTSIGVRSRFSG